MITLSHVLHGRSHKTDYIPVPHKDTVMPTLGHTNIVTTQ